MRLCYHRPTGSNGVGPRNFRVAGVRVAFIVENGAPIELLEFTAPNTQSVCAQYGKRSILLCIGGSRYGTSFACSRR